MTNTSKRFSEQAIVVPEPPNSDLADFVIETLQKALEIILASRLHATKIN
jgi:hypothetical protein